MTKFCIKCKEEKPVGEFYKDKQTRDGLRSSCNACVGKGRSEWAKANPESVKLSQKRWRKTNPEDCRRMKRRWERANPEKIKILRKRAYTKRMSTPKGRAENRLRGAFLDFRKGKRKKESALDLLGCSIEFFLAHIEEQFTEGMTWENMEQWDFDHIIPQSYFECTVYEERVICWHWSNFQPLWRAENRGVKNSKLPPDDKLKELITVIVNSL